MQALICIMTLIVSSSYAMFTGYKTLNPDGSCPLHQHSDAHQFLAKAKPLKAAGILDTEKETLLLPLPKSMHAIVFVNHPVHHLQAHSICTTMQGKLPWYDKLILSILNSPEIRKQLKRKGWMKQGFDMWLGLETEANDAERDGQLMKGWYHTCTTGSNPQHYKNYRKPARKLPWDSAAPSTPFEKEAAAYLVIPPTKVAGKEPVYHLLEDDRTIKHNFACIAALTPPAPIPVLKPNNLLAAVNLQTSSLTPENSTSLTHVSSTSKPPPPAPTTLEDTTDTTHPTRDTGKTTVMPKIKPNTTPEDTTDTTSPTKDAGQTTTMPKTKAKTTATFTQKTADMKGTPEHVVQEKPEATEPGSNVGLIVAVIVPAVIILLLITTILVLTKRRQRLREAKRGLRNVRKEDGNRKTAKPNDSDDMATLDEVSLSPATSEKAEGPNPVDASSGQFDDTSSVGGIPIMLPVGGHNKCLKREGCPCDICKARARIDEMAASTSGCTTTAGTLTAGAAAASARPPVPVPDAAGASAIGTDSMITLF